MDSFFSDFTSDRMARQRPVMTEAIRRIRAKGLQTAVLSNNFYLPSGDSFLPLDRRQFDVVSSVEQRGRLFGSARRASCACSRRLALLISEEP